MLAGWARGLLALDEAALVRIAFRDEPLRGKLTSAMKQSLYELSLIHISEPTRP